MRERRLQLGIRGKLPRRNALSLSNST